MPISSTSGVVARLREAADAGLDGGALIGGLSPVLRGLMYEIIVVEDPNPRLCAEAEEDSPPASLRPADERGELCAAAAW